MNALRSLAMPQGMPEPTNSLRRIGQENSYGGQDAVTLHVNPQEAEAIIPLLLAMGGSGRPDPMTGGIHFDTPDGPGGPSASGRGGENAAHGETGNKDGGYGPAGPDHGFGGYSGDAAFAGNAFAANGGWVGMIGRAFDDFFAPATGDDLGLMGKGIVAVAGPIAPVVSHGATVASTFGPMVRDAIETVTGRQYTGPEYSRDNGSDTPGFGGEDVLRPQTPSGPSGGVSVGSMGGAPAGGQNALAAMGSPLYVGTMRR